MLSLIYRIYCQFINFMDVEFLPPYDPSEDEKKNCKLFADNVRDVMSSAMKVPKVDADYDDVYFQENCLKKNGCQTVYSAKYINVEFAKLKAMVGIRRFYKGELNTYGKIWAAFAKREVEKNYAITCAFDLPSNAEQYNTRCFSMQLTHLQRDQ